MVDQGEDRDSHSPQRPSGIADAAMAFSMAFGRGPAARAIADISQLRAEDRVVDIGCGTGTAVRVASRRCKQVTGVDPSPASRRLGGWLNRVRGCRNAAIVDGVADCLPLPDRSATAVWALASFHHWPDQVTALAEVRRVLTTGGRMFVMERLVRPGAKGHAVHGLSASDLHDVEMAMTSAGFERIVQDQRTIGHTTWSIVSGTSRAS